MRTRMLIKATLSVMVVTRDGGRHMFMCSHPHIGSSNRITAEVYHAVVSTPLSVCGNAVVLELSMEALRKLIASQFQKLNQKVDRIFATLYSNADQVMRLEQRCAVLEGNRAPLAASGAPFDRTVGGTLPHRREAPLVGVDILSEEVRAVQDIVGRERLLRVAALLEKSNDLAAEAAAAAAEALQALTSGLQDDYANGLPVDQWGSTIAVKVGQLQRNEKLLLKPAQLKLRDVILWRCCSVTQGFHKEELGAAFSTCCKPICYNDEALQRCYSQLNISREKVLERLLQDNRSLLQPLRENCPKDGQPPVEQRGQVAAVAGGGK